MFRWEIVGGLGVWVSLVKERHSLAVRGGEKRLWSTTWHAHTGTM